MSFEVKQDAGNDLPKPELTQPVDGYCCYHWPETQALLNRLGVPFELRTTRVIIEMTDGEIVQVYHTYQGQDISKSPEEMTKEAKEVWDKRRESAKKGGAE